MPIRSSGELLRLECRRKSEEMIEKGHYVTPTGLAAWFVNQADRAAGEVITHLKVQKLIYYADAWFLANYNRPLVKENFEAWAHGPVCRPVFAKYRDCGYDPLPPEKVRAVPLSLEPFLKAVHSEYAQFSAKKLERLTHEEDPWKITRGDLAPEAKCEKPISKLLMRNYYAARLGKKEIKSLSN